MHDDRLRWHVPPRIMFHALVWAILVVSVASTASGRGKTRVKPPARKSPAPTPVHRVVPSPVVAYEPPVAIDRPLHAKTLQLANGLRLVVDTVPNKKTVQVLFLHRAGSVHEQDTPNLAQALRLQLTDQPTKTAAVSRASKVEADHTWYLAEGPSNSLSALLAEHVHRTTHDLKEARSAPLEAQQQEPTDALVFQGLAGCTPGGSPDVSWTQDELEAFRRRTYAPANTVIVIVSSASPDQVRVQAQRALGSLAGPTGDNPTAELPEQTNQRQRLVRTLDPPWSYELAWPTAPRFHPDHTAIELLAAVVTPTLWKAIQPTLEQPAPWQVGMALRSDPSCSRLLVEVEGESAVQLERSRRVSIDAIAKLCAEGPAKETMEQAWTQVLARRQKELDDDSSRAMLLGTSVLHGGGIEPLLTYLTNVPRTTSQDVQRVCKSYLRPMKRSIVARFGPPPPPASPRETTPDEVQPKGKAKPVKTQAAPGTPPANGPKKGGKKPKAAPHKDGKK